MQFKYELAVLWYRGVFANTPQPLSTAPQPTTLTLHYPCLAQSMTYIVAVCVKPLAATQNTKQTN